MKNFNKLNDTKHEIDLISLSDFLLEKGDDYLDKFIKKEFKKPEEITETYLKLWYKSVFNIGSYFGVSYTEFDFTGDDFPIEWYMDTKFLDTLFEESGIKFLMCVPKVLRYDYEVCERSINKNPISLKYVPKDIENYYGLVKLAFKKKQNLITQKWFPKEYIPQLKNDLDDELSQHYLNLQESKNSLLKEENFNEESFVFTSDRHKIDIKSLSNFLIEKGDRVLDTLLYARGYKEIDYYSDFFREEIIKYVNSDIIKKVPKELWDDYSFCLTLSSKNAYYAIDFINEDFLNDYNIVKNLLSQQGELINKVNPDILDEKLIRLANKTNTSGKDLTDTCYFWEHYDGRYELLKKIISVYPDKIRYIHANEYKYALDNKYYELFKIAYLKNKNIMRYNKLIKHWSYYERLKKEMQDSLLKEHISKQVRKLLKEKISL
jgi:hypothetical protein